MGNEKLSKIQLWNLLTEQQRRDTRQKYRLKASGSKEVINNRIIRDGVQGSDLEPLDINVLYDLLDIKPKTNEKIKEEITKQDNEETVQRSDSGRSDDNKPKERESISKQARDKQNKTKDVQGRS